MDTSNARRGMFGTHPDLNTRSLLRKQTPYEHRLFNPPGEPMHIMDALALVTSPFPVVGDATGIAADARRFIQEPESRTPLNYALAGAGAALPFFPAMTVGRKIFGSMWSEKAIKDAANQNFKSREILIEMTPQDFLQMADDFKPDPGKAKRIAEARAAGKPMESVPNLSFENQGGGRAKVTGHEGRHRALQAIEEGHDVIPVVLQSQEGGAGRAIRWGSQDAGSYDYVDDFPTVLEAEGGQASTMPFPAQRNQYFMPEMSSEMRRVQKR